MTRVARGLFLDTLAASTALASRMLLVAIEPVASPGADPERLLSPAPASAARGPHHRSPPVST